MKRFLALLCVLLILPLFAIGEAVDYSAMSLDELLETKKLILEEIGKKYGIEERTVTDCFLVVGEDIPDGRYDLILVGLRANSSVVAIFDSVEQLSNAMWSGQLLGDAKQTFFYSSQLNLPILTDLKDGNVLFIDEDGTFLLKKH